ncbi:MAG: hypothetical protein ABJB74_17850, partial [Gemmatimonas sp.]
LPGTPLPTRSAPRPLSSKKKWRDSRFPAHTTVLATQPKSSEYIGNYLGDTIPIVVRVVNGRITVGANALSFYALDLAYSAQDGTPVEFIRNDAGVVTWIRVGGQGFARKTN